MMTPVRGRYPLIALLKDGILFLRLASCLSSEALVLLCRPTRSSSIGVARVQLSVDHDAPIL
eukprot:scaffold10764_cov159-Ochromonas_danica.AAC.38